jgi:hypothetical protein
MPRRYQEIIDRHGLYREALFDLSLDSESSLRSILSGSKLKLISGVAVAVAVAQWYKYSDSVAVVVLVRLDLL